MRFIRTGLVILTGLATLPGVVATSADAAAIVTNHYTVTYDTGLRGFVASFPEQSINSETGAVIGSTVSDTSGRYTVAAFDPRYGTVQNIGGIVQFYGYPFEATFDVEGATDSIGDKVVAHEDVSGTITMLVNGKSVASTPFDVSLNPSCTASNNGFTVILCSDEQKQTYFSSSLPVAIKAGDVVNFQYSMTEANVSCQVDFAAGGSPGVCIEGDTGITDLNNIQDPEWGSSLAVTYDYIPEPASMSVLGVALAGMVGARRRRCRA